MGGNKVRKTSCLRWVIEIQGQTRFTHAGAILPEEWTWEIAECGAGGAGGRCMCLTGRLGRSAACLYVMQNACCAGPTCILPPRFSLTQQMGLFSQLEEFANVHVWSWIVQHLVGTTDHQSFFGKDEASPYVSPPLSLFLCLFIFILLLAPILLLWQLACKGR